MTGARLFGPGYIQRGVEPPRVSASLSHRAGKKHIMNPQIPASRPIKSIIRRISIGLFDRVRRGEPRLYRERDYGVLRPSSAACTWLCFRL